MTENFADLTPHDEAADELIEFSVPLLSTDYPRIEVDVAGRVHVIDSSDPDPFTWGIET